MANKFKNIFQSLRKEKGLTQAQLANLLDITRQSVSNYELGVRFPDYTTLELIADFFNVDLDYLTGRSEIRNRYANEFANIENNLDDDMVILARDLQKLTKQQKDLVRNMIDEFNKQNEED